MNHTPFSSMFKYATYTTIALFFIINNAPLAAADQVYRTYAEVASSDVPSTTLLKVISRDGKSKCYDDLLPLDGGTVGIAHFAVGGLKPLYRNIDTEKYFNRSQEEMIANFSVACRPKGKSGNDTGWGCFSKPWWNNGMKAFLTSAESHQAQNAAWTDMMKPVIEIALSNNWNDARSLAISLGIANSVGKSGFVSLAKAYHWDAEDVLTAYVGKNEHRRRRQVALDKNFPKSN